MVVALLLSATVAKQSYSFQASFVEGCSCKDICVTEITGRDAGCHGVAAMRFDRGSYGGKSFWGSSAAWAWDSGKWVRLYIDAPAQKRAAITAFMTAALKDWGKLESVTPGTISLVRRGKGYAASVEGLNIVVQPVFGGDGKTAVTHANLTSPFHSTLMQGETVRAVFKPVPHAFTLEKTNGFYNPKCVMSGKL